MKKMLILGLVLSAATPAALSEPLSDPLGEGVAAYALQRYERAHALWLPLAQAGQAEAQFRLGLLYELGRGVQPDPRAARHWYQQAAENGHGQAALSLANLLAADGEAEPALAWFERAADLGEARAQYHLGMVLASRGDLQAAWAWLDRAAETFRDGGEADRARTARDRVAARLAGEG